MSPEELEAGYAWIYRRLFSLSSIWARRPRQASAVLPYLAMALLYKRSNFLWRFLTATASRTRCGRRWCTSPACVTCATAGGWRAKARCPGTWCPHPPQRVALPFTTLNRAPIPLMRFFGSALQVTPLFHSLVPDGVFVPRECGVRFEPLPPPTQVEVERLLMVVRNRVLRLLEKRGALPAQGPEDALHAWQRALGPER